MLFASLGALRQKSMLIQAKRSMFLFDSTVNVETAMSSISSWAKECLKARSAVCSIQNNKFSCTLASGVKANRYYFAHLNAAPSIPQNISDINLINVAQDLTRGASRYRKWLTKNKYTYAGIGDPMYGYVSDLGSYAVSDINSSLSGTSEQMCLVPSSMAGKAVNIFITADETKDLSSYSGDKYGFVSISTYCGIRCYDIQTDVLTSKVSPLSTVTAGNPIQLPGDHFPEGFFVPFMSYNRSSAIYGGGSSNSYFQGIGTGGSVKTAGKFWTVASMPDTPDFDYEWGTLVIWNGERFLGQVIRRDRDFVQNKQGSTAQEPDLTLIQDEPMPFSALLDV